MTAELDRARLVRDLTRAANETLRGTHPFDAFLEIELRGMRVAFYTLVGAIVNGDYDVEDR